MPLSSLRLRPTFKGITDGTRALHYSLLSRTDSDDALIPTEGCEDLCGSCAKLPFDEIFTTEEVPPPKDDSPPLSLTSDNDGDDDVNPKDEGAFDIGSYSEIEGRRTCPFCSFVRTLCLVSLPWNWITKLKANPHPLKIHPGRRAWSYFELYEPEGDDIAPCAAISHPDCSDEKTTYLQNYLGVWAICKTDTATEPRLSPRIRKRAEVVDGTLEFDLLKSWMKNCGETHETCGRVQPPVSSSGVKPYLIDVERMEVVRSQPEYEYAALSYVWGTDEDNKIRFRSEDQGFEIIMGGRPKLPSRERQNPLDEACQTVVDAMKVTKDIGLKYLWVDSYCISSDPVQRSLHIKQMDKIYEGAWLTIVALSGTHANYGLPGVSVPLEVTPQPCVELEAGTFVATRLSTPMADAQTSPWNKRAWTMQEAALSRRCLCFTATSVFWMCAEELQYDFVEASFERMGGHFTKFPYSVTGMGDQFLMENFRELITQYSTRKLTSPGDALDAITGILNHLSKKTGVEFCYGHPQTEFVRSLLWKSDNTRRHELPSWSWLGWHDEVTVPMWLETRDEISEPGLLGLELQDGESETYFVKELEIAQVVQLPTDDQSSRLILSSQVARFKAYRVLNKGMSFTPAEKYITRDEDGDAELEEAHSDLWCIDMPHRFRAPCPHDLFGYSYGSNYHSCFGTDPETSKFIRPSGTEHEFVLLAHWREYAKSEQDEWVPVARDFFEGDKGIGDVVLAVLIVRDSNHNAHRVSLVPIPYENWAAASREEMAVTFV